MTRTAFFCALLCLALAVFLARRAWRHSRSLRAWLRARPLDPGDLGALTGTAPLLARVRGVLEPAVDDALVPTAPFSERRVLWVRAELRGSPPGSPVSHPHAGAHALVLWERSLSAPARVAGASVGAGDGASVGAGDGNATLSIPLDHPRLRVFAAQEYRHGVVRTLTRVSKVAARALVRAGYTQPPPPDQLFTLEEEALQPGDEVLVFGLFSEGKLVAPPESPSEPPRVFAASAYEGDLAHPLWVTNLPPWRVTLRLGWAPVLALWLALLCVLAGGAVLGAWLVAR